MSWLRRFTGSPVSGMVPSILGRLLAGAVRVPSPPSPLAGNSASVGPAVSAESSEAAAGDLPEWILQGSKGGTPKRKHSPTRKQRVTHGIHFKNLNLKHVMWYHCPLCGEAKRENEWCRREDCRQLKP